MGASGILWTNAIGPTALIATTDPSAAGELRPKDTFSPCTAAATCRIGAWVGLQHPVGRPVCASALAKCASG